MKSFIGLVLLLLSSSVFAQTVQQSGSVSPNHPACWVTTGVINDCGVPAIVPYLLASPPLTLTDGSTVTPDLSQAVEFNWTLAAPGRTLANPVNINSASIGQRIVIYLIQGGSGSNTVTSWGSVYKFSGGVKPTLTAALGSIDRVICDIQTTSVFTCAATLNFQ